MSTARLIPVTLIEAARAGDEKALQNLLKICQPDVRRYAQLTCSNSADAEDAIQQVTIIIYQHIGALQFVGAFSSWLKTVVRRECLRLARKLGPRNVEIDTVENDLRFSSLPTSQLRQELAEAISSLPESYSEILLLRDFEGLTMKEIADQLGLTVENSKVRLHRARFLVREYFSA